MKPRNLSGPRISATAENRDTVAIEPLSKYWKGSRRGGVGAGEFGLDRRRDVLGAELLRSPGHAFHGGHVADDEDVGRGWTGRAAPGPDRPGRVPRGHVGEVPAQPARLDSGGPTLQADSMRRSVPSESLTVMPSRSTSVTMPPLTQLFAHRRQYAGSSRITRASGRVDVAKRALQRVFGQFGYLPGHFNTGRADGHGP